MEHKNRMKIAQKEYKPMKSSIDYVEFLKRYKVDLSDKDRVKKHLYPFVKDSLKDMIEDFYIWLEKQPEYEEFFNNNAELIERVKSKQELYWAQVFTSDLDQDFFDTRISLATTHATIGLPLNSYFAGLAFFVNWIIKKINTNISTKIKANNNKAISEILDAEVSFLKLTQIDQELVVTHYVSKTNAHLDELINRQADTIIKLATPISILADGILLVSIIGVIDSGRSQSILETTLTKIVETTSKVVLIDISGVELVDTAIANHFIKMTQAIKLIGCLCILSGISPRIAQTMVQLGIDLKDIVTKSGLKDAVEEAYLFISKKDRHSLK